MANLPEIKKSATIIDPIETRNGVYRILDKLLDGVVNRVYVDEGGLGQVTEVGDLGDGRRLTVRLCRYDERARVGERLLTGKRTIQPVVALEINNGRRTITPLAYGEDIVSLPITFPAKVIGCLNDFNASKVS